MVRIKFRYIGIKYSFDTLTKYNINNKTFLDIITNHIKIEHGEIGVSKLTDFQITDNYPNNNIILFRVGRESKETILKILNQIKVLNGKKCDFSILGVSGAIRNVKNKILKHLKNN
ncbi:hypothetical protein H312_00475 [Anncaliia algerae PRA339]|uniref:Ribonuclease P/MRP protein subunit POP5 n=1 Tax=Anncaliia algerae PRA339 TaxID=1288291 RepID=A0A059F3Z4_9MICR|nr:hypothetical protein H312_00475 [Anncaliia algerae PRA339]